MAWLVVVLLVALALLVAQVQVLQRDLHELKAKMLRIDPQAINHKLANLNRRLQELETKVKRLR